MMRLIIRNNIPVSNLGKTDFINRKFRCRLGGARDCCQLPTTGDALAAHIQRAGLYIHPPRASEPPSDRRHRGTILPGTSATVVSSTVA